MVVPPLVPLNPQLPGRSKNGSRVSLFFDFLPFLFIHSFFFLTADDYDPGMAIVARIELLILLRAILGVITFQNSLLIPIAYVHFLRSRYYYSAFTRGAVHSADTLIQSYVNKEQTPPAVKRVYASGKEFVMKWA